MCEPSLVGGDFGPEVCFLSQIKTLEPDKEIGPDEICGLHLCEDLGGFGGAGLDYYDDVVTGGGGDVCVWVGGVARGEFGAPRGREVVEGRQDH